MIIGVSTWAYQDLPLTEALERISRLSDHAEIICEAKHSLFDPANLEAVESFSLKYTVHGLMTDVNIASIYPSIRRASVELHRKAIQASVESCASVYVVHPGHTSWDSYRPAAMRALDESLADLTPIADDSGIHIAVENMPKSDYLFFDRPGLDLKGLGLVLDVGHANTCGTLGEFMKCDVAHVHLHDNAGGNDDHLPIGRGSIDFIPVLKMIEDRDITAVLEQKTEQGVQESLKSLKALAFKI